MIPTKYDLHLFTDYMQPDNLSFNQYLLLTGEPVLFPYGQRPAGRRPAAAVGGGSCGPAAKAYLCLAF